MLKKIIKKIINKAGYKIISSKYPADIMKEKEFIKIYEKCKDYTRVPIESSFVLYKIIKKIIQNNIPGDLVECGVWRGGQTMMMALTLLGEGVTDRNIWLYDTFTGMTEPKDEDIQIGSGLKGKDWWKKVYILGYKKNYFVASQDEVEKNMHSTGYPPEKIKFIKGMVEQTIPRDIPREISLLRLDTDWHESTSHEMVYLYPILSKGGALIIDDYGKWEGSKKAVDEYLQKHDSKIFLCRTPNGVVTGIKTSDLLNEKQ